MIHSQYNPGIHLAGDGIVWHRHRLSKPGKDKLIVISHGRTPAQPQFQACLQFQQTAVVYAKLDRLLAAGYAIICVDNMGNLTYGNDAAINSLDKAIDWARTNWAHPTARVVVMGYSMGGIPTAYYAKNNPNKVAGMLGFAPALDLAWLASDPAYSAEVAAAYPGGIPAGRDPFTFAATFDKPVKLFHAVDDAAIPYTKTRQWYRDIASPSKSYTQWADGGHSNFWDKLDPSELIGWLGGLDWGI